SITAMMPRKRRVRAAGPNAAVISFFERLPASSSTATLAMMATQRKMATEESRPKVKVKTLARIEKTADGREIPRFTPRGALAAIAIPNAPRAATLVSAASCEKNQDKKLMSFISRCTPIAPRDDSQEDGTNR